MKFVLKTIIIILLIFYVNSDTGQLYKICENSKLKNKQICLQISDFVNKTINLFNADSNIDLNDKFSYLYNKTNLIIGDIYYNYPKFFEYNFTNSTCKQQILNLYNNFTEFNYSNLYLECEDHIIIVYAKIFDVLNILLRFYHLDTIISIVLSASIYIVDFLS